MEWASLAREELDELISTGPQAMDDTVQAAWAAAEHQVVSQPEE